MKVVPGVFTVFLLWLAGGLYGQEDIFDPYSITEIRLSFAEKFWADSLEKYKEDPSEPRLEANLKVNGLEYQSVGVRYKGNSSYHATQRKGEKKLPFNIKIDYLIEDQTLPGGYDKLKLSNGFRDPSFLREVLGYEIARRYMPAPRANFARVYVNGDYLGLYTSVESVDKQFLTRQFGEKDGVLIKCDPEWGYQHPDTCSEGDQSSLEYLGPDSACYVGLYEMKSDYGWSHLIQLTDILNHQPEKLDHILDIDQTLWWLAFNNVVVNLDSYQGAFCHNYYLYRDDSGVFHPIIWDLNLAFGGFRLVNLEGQTSLSDREMQEMSMFIHYKQKNEKRPLLTHLLADDLYRKMYVAHIKTIVEDFFANGQFLDRAKQLQSLIQEHVYADQYKLYSDSAFLYNLDTTQEAGTTSIIGVKELMQRRTAYLLNHKLIQEETPQVSEPTYERAGETVTIRVQMKGAQAGWLFCRKAEEKTFKKQAMIFMGPDREEGATSGWEEYEVELPYDASLKYFVVAEGRINARVHPPRSGMTYFTLSEQ